MKPVIAAVLLSLISVCASAAPAKASDNVTVLARDERGVTRLSPPDTSYIGEWIFNDDWTVMGRHTCRYEKFLDWWPLEPKCEGTLYIEYNVYDANGKLVLDKVLDRNVRTKFGGGPDLRISVAGKTGTAAELYEMLLTEGKPVVVVENHQVELPGFFDLSKQSYSRHLNEMKDAVAEKRWAAMLQLASVIGALAVAGFVLQCLYRKIPAVASRLKEAVGGLDHMHVRRVARDEVIRQTARDAVAASGENDKEALRNHIKQAVDRGDHELAGELIAVLKKFESR